MAEMTIFLNDAFRAATLTTALNRRPASSRAREYRPAGTVLKIARSKAVQPPSRSSKPASAAPHCSRRITKNATSVTFVPCVSPKAAPSTPTKSRASEPGALPASCSRCRPRWPVPGRSARRRRSHPGIHDVGCHPGFGARCRWLHHPRLVPLSSPCWSTAFDDSPLNVWQSPAK